jgi:hypothetical protein
MYSISAISSAEFFIHSQARDCGMHLVPSLFPPLIRLAISGYSSFRAIKFALSELAHPAFSGAENPLSESEITRLNRAHFACPW